MVVTRDQARRAFAFAHGFFGADTADLADHLGVDRKAALAVVHELEERGLAQMDETPTESSATAGRRATGKYAPMVVWLYDPRADRWNRGVTCDSHSKEDALAVFDAVWPEVAGTAEPSPCQAHPHQIGPAYYNRGAEVYVHDCMTCKDSVLCDAQACEKVA